jgi:hypothetical protein
VSNPKRTVIELAEFDELAGRLNQHANNIRNPAARAMADDMRLAARLISTLLQTGVIHSAVVLV